MGSLTKRKIELNRKVLSEIAAKHPTVFEKIVKG
jgi:ribosomal protein L20